MKRYKEPAKQAAGKEPGADVPGSLPAAAKSADDEKAACAAPKGRISSVETFGSVDGPGIRYIVFLSGCRLRCLYCHNPETWGEKGGEEKSAAAVLAAALRYRPYWKGGGGITVSGGEPLLQAPFVAELFRLAGKEGISTCLDTAGEPFERGGQGFAAIARAVARSDLVLLDIKHIDDEKHKKLTGRTNKNILDFARYLAEQKKPVWLRHVLLPGYTDDTVSLNLLSRFAAGLGNVERFEVLPYHSMARAKYERLHIPYPLPHTIEPSADAIQRAEEILRVADYRGYEKK